MKIKQAVTLLSSLMLSTSVMAASPDRGRWFDIEVILISQLGDKASLKEIFADGVKLPSFKNPLDLLTPYLIPDIAHLKQKLPFCDSKNQTFQYHDDIHTPSIITIKPLSVIENEIEDEIDQTINNADTLAGTLTETSADNQLLSTNEALDQETNYQNDDFFDRVTTEKEKTDEEQFTQVALSNSNEFSSGIDDDLAPAISSEQIVLMNAAEQAFSPVQFTYTNSSTNTTASANNENLLCQITKNEFESLAPDKNSYSYLGFAVNNVPNEISAIEDLYNSKPYLLNKDSLALNNIVTQLKRSRDFKSVLHIGWRQPVSSRRKAIPIKLFAGDNLQQNYIEQLKLYQQKKNQVMAQEQSVNALLSNHSNSESILTEQAQLDKNKEQRLNNIIEQLSVITDDTTALINELDQAPTPLNIEEIANNNLMLNPPAAPAQPWYLQGFMQIYINNNNRLNIIADFNMLNLTLAEQETIMRRPNTQLELQTVSFKQHRQVISTETHYFDHPYLGMIVQIRRHDRPERPIESNNEQAQ